MTLGTGSERSPFAEPMLRWRGQTSFGGSYLGCGVAVAPGLRLYTVTREDMIYDSSFTPAEPTNTDDTLVLYVLLCGRMWLRNPEQRFEAPAMLLMPRALIDGSDGLRPRTFRNGGAPLRAVQLHFPRAAWLGPAYQPGQVLALNPDPLTLLNVYTAADRFETGESSQCTAAAFEVIDAILKLGWVSYEVRPVFNVDWTETLGEVWHGLGIAWSRTSLPSLPYLSKLLRKPGPKIYRELTNLASVLGVPPPLHWRTMMLANRLALASALLSAKEASAVSVGLELNYRYPDALVRAFRNAGFPHPTTIREMLRATAAELGV